MKSGIAIIAIILTFTAMVAVDARMGYVRERAYFAECEYTGSRIGQRYAKVYIYLCDGLVEESKILVKGKTDG